MQKSYGWKCASYWRFDVNFERMCPNDPAYIVYLSHFYHLKIIFKSLPVTESLFCQKLYLEWVTWIKDISFCAEKNEEIIEREKNDFSTKNAMNLLFSLSYHNFIFSQRIFLKIWIIKQEVLAVFRRYGV